MGAGPGGEEEAGARKEEKAEEGRESSSLGAAPAPPARIKSPAPKSLSNKAGTGR